MTTSILALCAGLITAAGAGQERFVESHLIAPGKLAAYKVFDVDLDGNSDFVLVVLGASGGRSLAIYYQRRGGVFPPQPDTTIAIKDDVIGYTIADVRPDPGREILFLTRTGIYSYSPGIEGYRDNIARLASIDLLYDVADPRHLPFWPYVAHRYPGPDLLYAPGEGRLAVLAADESGHYRITEEILTPPAPRAALRTQLRLTSASLSVGFRTSQVQLIVPGQVTTGIGGGEILLHVSRNQPAPVFADVDGDGIVDLLVICGIELRVHRGLAQGSFSPAPTRREKLTSLLGKKETDTLSVNLLPVDIDGDGLLDLVVSPGERSRVQRDEGQVVDIYRGRPERMVGAAPDRRLKFDALRIDPRVIDADGDGRNDLVVLAWNTPIGPQALSGVTIERSLMIFPGAEDGLPARSPAIDDVRNYSPEEILALEVTSSLEGDFDGDGLHDLAEIDDEGAVAIRPLRRTTSLLGSEGLDLADTPFYRYRPGRRVRGILALEIGQDRVSDLLVELEDELVVFVSQPETGSRGG